MDKRVWWWLLLHVCGVTNSLACLASLWRLHHGMLCILNIVSTQLDPNAWATLQALWILCKVLGLIPSPPMFLHHYNTRPKYLVTLLSLFGQLKTCLFAPYISFFKSFKNTFFRGSDKSVELFLLLWWRQTFGLTILFTMMIGRGPWSWPVIVGFLASWIPSLIDFQLGRRWSYWILFFHAMKCLVCVCLMPLLGHVLTRLTSCLFFCRSNGFPWRCWFW